MTDSDLGRGMATGMRNGMIDRLRRMTDRTSGPAPSDGELLARFISIRDEEAFAVLVRRHGPLVLAVCRRVTADAELADDAFQAVFLVLAKKADTVRPREAVRGWLYGVATRTALRARTMTGRREKRETLVGAVPDRPAPPKPDTDPDALRILDEEIARLPEWLRAPVVLCELDGVGRKDAATRLRVPEGTLSSRLAKARKLLAKRLRERGVVMPAAGFAALLGSPQAAMSGERIGCTARAALGSETPSAVVANLSREVMRTMFLSKLKYISGLLAAVAVASLSLSPSGPVAEAAPVAAPRPAVPLTLAVAPVQKAAPREPVLMVWCGGAPLLLTPEGKEVLRPKPDDWLGNKWGGDLTLAKFSPDGKRVLYSEVTDGANGPPVKSRHLIRPLTGDDKPIEVVKDIRGPYSFWSRDGKRVYGFGLDPEQDDKRHPKQGQAPPPVILGPQLVENWMVDLATGKKSAVKVPNTCTIKDESPDGRRFLTVEAGNEKTPDEKLIHTARTFLTTPGENLDHVRFASDLGDHLIGLSFSPDGTKVLALRSFRDKLYTYELLSIDVKTEKAVRLQAPEEGGIQTACWSPDGKKVAYVWFEYAPAPPGGVPGAPGAPVPAQPPVAGPTQVFVGSHIMIVDADGKNRTKVHAEKDIRSLSIDWR